MSSGKEVYSPQRVEAFLKRLRGTGGEIKSAAESLGLQPVLIKRWKQKHPEFKQECERVVAEAKTSA